MQQTSVTIPQSSIEERYAGELARTKAELAELVAVLSHDLAEPLQVTAGFARLLAEREEPALDASTRKCLVAIQAGARRAHALIDDLAAYARLDLPPAPAQSVDCARVFEDTLRRVSGRIEAAAGSVTAGPLPVVCGHRPLFDIIFEELITNAIAFAAPVGPVVHVSAERGGATWELRVRDNGVGIDAAQHERIFAVFHRVQRRDDGATGIGLARCRKAAELLGGRLWVTSRPGAGSTFHLTLPAREERSCASS